MAARLCLARRYPHTPHVNDRVQTPGQGVHSPANGQRLFYESYASRKDLDHATLPGFRK